MNELQVFSFKDNQVRTQQQNNEVWFCLKDVCDILELNQPSRVKERLNKDGVTTIKVIDNMGRLQETNFINESNLYKVIFQSRKPQAEQFTEWVTSEVLPTIRRTGSYQVPTNPMQALELMFQAQKETNDTVAKHDMRIKELENNKLLNPSEYNYIASAIKRKAKETLTLFEFELSKKSRSKVYSSINRDLNTYIGIKTRCQFKAKDFDKALEFIENWQLSYTDKKIIEQLSLDL